MALVLVLMVLVLVLLIIVSIISLFVLLSVVCLVCLSSLVPALAGLGSSGIVLSHSVTVLALTLVVFIIFIQAGHQDLGCALVLPLALS
jgi:hypothetical protein